MELSAYWLKPRPSPYPAVWQAMQAATAARGPGTADAIWLTEHDAVYTLGQAGRRAHVLSPKDIPVLQTDRGGQITYHAPGQLVAYVLYDLRRAGIYVREYVRRLEEAVLGTLAACGVADATRYPGAPGIYLPANGADPARHPITHFHKIAALGVKVRNGCTYHGLALNVAMDLQPFAGIEPCGYQGLSVTDLRQQGSDVSLDTVAQYLVAELQQQLAPQPEAQTPRAQTPITTRSLEEAVAQFQSSSTLCNT